MYLRQDKKIGMYVDFGVLCTRYLISGWDFQRILFWKRSNLAKKSLQLSPLSISSHRVLNFIYIQDKKRLTKCALRLLRLQPDIVIAFALKYIIQLKHFAISACFQKLKDTYIV